MKRTFKLRTAVFALCLLGLASCSEDYTFTPPKISGVAFDPSKPVTVTQILPDSGVYLTQFVIKGSNFGMDKSKLSVLFGGRKAAIVSTNGTEIYGITPKQDNGFNDISVSVEEGTPAVLESKFKYTKKEQVNFLTGGGGYVDGTLAESRFSYMRGIGVVAGNNLIVSDPRDNQRVRLVSPEEDKVTTLLTNVDCAKPAITKDRKTLYLCTRTTPHALYEFKQENGWVPKRLSKGLTDFTGEIWSMALDDTEEWLYVRDGKGVFGRVSVSDPNNVEIINEECGAAQTNQTSYLIWDPFDKRFFLSVQGSGGIYTVSQDGKKVEQYAGFNGLATLDGPRQEAKFMNPVGMTQDLEGNLFVIDSGQHILRKIDRATGMVSVVVGRAGSAGDEDGDPLDARLNWPYDVACDDEGNLYIAEGWGNKIKKYAIE